MSATMVQRQRLYAEQVPEWQRFQTTSLAPTFVSNGTSGSSGSYEAAAGNSHHGYQRQYAHVYHQRSEILSKVLLAQYDSDSQGQSAQVVSRILELPEDVLVTCVGTLVRESNEVAKPSSPPRSTDYSYFLEDESGRVAVSFDSLVHSSDVDGEKAPEPPEQLYLCTGLVIRVTGMVGTDGVLAVNAIATVATVSQLTCSPTVSTPPVAPAASSPHLLLLSGLECGSAQASSLPRDMLISYVQGLFGHKALSVAHIIVAGGLVSSSAVVDGCRDLDGFVRQLTQASGVPVTVLPGKDDPTTAQWPQRPLHSSLLPLSSTTSLLSRSPNPYAATFAAHPSESDESTNHDRLVVGTDGANVADFMRQTLLSSELDALRHTLTHQHVCPTGPDTVPTVPHAHADPMVLASLSHQPSLYFMGNAAQFATQLVSVQTSGKVTTCRLVCIPKFIESGTAVLVNLDTLAVELLKFDDSALE